MTTNEELPPKPLSRDDVTQVRYALTQRYQAAMRDSGLPHRSPSHRIAAQLVAAAQAAAYARALAIVLDDITWKGRAAQLDRDVQGRAHIDQADIDSAERAESAMRRYGLHGLR